MARPMVCEGHAKQVHDHVRGLPLAYVRLRSALVPSKSWSEHVSGTRSPQSAMAISVWGVMEDMVDRTAQWARLAREHRGVDPLRRIPRPGPLLVLAVESLLRHDETILKLSVAGQYVADMRNLKARSERMLKADRLIHRLDVPCPACETMALYRRDGDEWVVCGACSARWDETHYRRLVKVLAYQVQIMEHRR
jgi:hypothetical protein